MVAIITAVLSQCGGGFSGGSGMRGAETGVGRGGFFGNARGRNPMSHNIVAPSGVALIVQAMVEQYAHYNIYRMMRLAMAHENYRYNYRPVRLAMAHECYQYVCWPMRLAMAHGC